MCSWEFLLLRCFNFTSGFFRLGLARGKACLFGCQGRSRLEGVSFIQHGRSLFWSSCWCSSYTWNWPALSQSICRILSIRVLVPILNYCWKDVAVGAGVLRGNVSPASSCTSLSHSNTKLWSWDVYLCLWHFLSWESSQTSDLYISTLTTCRRLFLIIFTLERLLRSAPQNFSFLQMFVFAQFISFTQHLYFSLHYPAHEYSYTWIVNYLKVGAVYFWHFLGFQHPDCTICWLKKGMLLASSCCRVKIGQGIVKQFFELVIVTSLEWNQHLSSSSQANAWTLYRDVYKASF